MSAIAACLQKAGFHVEGSDSAASDRTARLERAGVKVYCGQAAEHLDGVDIVVCSSAISDRNPELCAARERGLPIYDRAEVLNMIAGCFPQSVGIAGCHGKTTATAMCAHVLQECTGSCTAHIGGEDYDYGNFFAGGEGCFVTEVCEYRGNLLKVRPSVAVILNTDADHLECYGSAEALLEAYVTYAQAADAAIVCGEDPIARRVSAVRKFGFGRDCDVRAVNPRSSGGRYSFCLSLRGENYDKIRLNVYGRHHVYNALAAAAVADYYGYPPAHIAGGLQAFRGIRRRFERLGRLNGAEMIADYAHHPREIAAALRTAQELGRGRVFVIFQPHTYSRTRLLFEDFLAVLSSVENLVIYKTFPAREYFDAAGSALTLSEHLPNSLYIESVRELAIYLRCSLRVGDTALFLGAGDIYYAAKQLLRG